MGTVSQATVTNLPKNHTGGCLRSAYFGQNKSPKKGSRCGVVRTNSFSNLAQTSNIVHRSKYTFSRHPRCLFACILLELLFLLTLLFMCSLCLRRRDRNFPQCRSVEVTFATCRFVTHQGITVNMRIYSDKFSMNGCFFIIFAASGGFLRSLQQYIQNASCDRTYKLVGYRHPLISQLLSAVRSKAC